MRAIHWAIIAFALILTCLWAMFTLSAKASECTNFDATVAALEQRGAKPFIIDPARLPKVIEDAEALTGTAIPGTPTRGFIIFGDSITVLGIEVDGCLNDPVFIHVPKPVSSVEPGASKNGTGA